MKLKAKRSFRHGAKTYARGADVAVPELEARDLIKRGLVAEEGKAPEAPPAKHVQTERKQKSGKAGNQRRDEQSATSGRAAERKED